MAERLPLSGNTVATDNSPKTPQLGNIPKKSPINVVIGGDTPDRAIVDLRIELDRNEKTQGERGVFKSARPNILKRWSNVSPVFTLAPLSVTELNQLNSDGSLPKKLSNVVFSSGGRYDSDRTKTFYGSPEYFINNVEITTFNTPTKISGLSGNLTINFDIIEPYSVGLFMQSLQTAAQNSGYTNYVECPFILKIEFFGYQPNSMKLEIVPNSTRDYPIKLQQIQFTSNEGGSKYIVKCLDFNLEAFNNVYGNIEGSISIEGNTVREVLNDLSDKLTKSQAKLVKDKVIQIGDTYKIIIAGEDPDKIANSKFVKAEQQPQAAGSNRDNVKNETNSRNQATPGKRSFSFPAVDGGTKIVQIIEEVLKVSEYCTNALKNIPSDGYVKWYRPSAKLKYLGSKFQLDIIQNRPAYDIEYYVKPYSVHHSVLKGPADPSKGFEPDNIPSKVNKIYDYLYTGQNDDIVRWELKFDNTFYTAMSPTSFNSQRGAIEGKGKLLKPDDTGGNTPGSNALGLNQLTHAGRMLRDKRGSYEAPKGGNSVDDTSIRVARAFEQAMLLETEMIMLDMTVLGDPYYLTKSGVFIDNVAPTEAGSMENNDETMATESTEVAVYVRFKSPIDAPKLGKSLFLFPAAGFIDSPYSGLYKIRAVKSKFNDGVFTNELNLMRYRGQQPEEILNARQDPFLQSPGLSVSPDPNRIQTEGTPAAAAAPPAPVVTRVEPESAGVVVGIVEDNSSTVSVTQIVPFDNDSEITSVRRSDNAPRGGGTLTGINGEVILPRDYVPTHKVGPSGQKLPPDAADALDWITNNENE
jgi:hypothetical protein